MPDAVLRNFSSLLGFVFIWGFVSMKVLSHLVRLVIVFPFLESLVGSIWTSYFV